MTRKHAHYFKDVTDLKVVDIYRLIDLFDVHSSALQHALKKIFAAGQRGSKDADTDIQEAIDTLRRWQEMRDEDREAEKGNPVDPLHRPKPMTGQEGANDKSNRWPVGVPHLAEAFEDEDVSNHPLSMRAKIAEAGGHWNDYARHPENSVSGLRESVGSGRKLTEERRAVMDAFRLGKTLDAAMSGVMTINGVKVNWHKVSVTRPVPDWAFPVPDELPVGSFLVRPVGNNTTFVPNEYGGLRYIGPKSAVLTEKGFAALRPDPNTGTAPAKL